MKNIWIIILTIYILNFICCNSTSEIKNEENGKHEYSTITGIIMRKIPSGTFTMGSDIGEYEKPEHKVTITRSFYMSKYEITNEQFCNVMNWALNRSYAKIKNGDLYNSREEIVYCGIRNVTRPSIQFGLEIENGLIKPKADRELHPVVCVSWYGAIAFCNFLSKIEGKEIVYDLDEWSCDWTKIGYRLPTEAEWEYASKGQTNRKYPWGDIIDGRYANFDNSGDSFESTIKPYTQNGGPTTPVGYYNGSKRNGFQTMDNSSIFGIYDMSGNVYEFIWDAFKKYTAEEQIDPNGPIVDSNYSDIRILRGGSWVSFSDVKLNIAFRSYMKADVLSSTAGFRIARSAE